MRSASLRCLALVAACFVTACGRDEGGAKKSDVEAVRAKVEKLHKETAELEKVAEEMNDRALLASARSHVATFKLALLLHRHATKRYPNRLEDLLEKTSDPQSPYLDKVPRDPWGHVWTWTPAQDAGSAVLTSEGPDGRPGTPDDIVETFPGKPQPR